MADAHSASVWQWGRLAADAVPMMPEDCGANLPADEADEVGAESCERSDQGIFVGEEESGED